MLRSQVRCFKRYFFLAVVVDIAISQQVCQSPDIPINGDYTPKQNQYEPREKVNFNCSEGFTLLGNDSSRCKSNGDWSNPTPFCDLKTRLKNSFSQVKSQPSNRPEVIDGNLSTCYSLPTGASVDVTLVEKGHVFAIRILLDAGSIKLQVSAGREVCGSSPKFIETRQWILIECINNSGLTKSVKIQGQTEQGVVNTICEIEVYAKDEYDCINPPERRIPNGYFEISRSRANLICENGYSSQNTGLFCEGNNWMGPRLQCDEILCDPLLNMSSVPGSEWIPLDGAKKNSVGTRRELKCGRGYKKTGSSDKIVCQKDGTWTKTNATCEEILCDPKVPGKEWIILDSVQKVSKGTRSQLKCDNGYKKTGDTDLIVCQEDGTWTKTNATCKEDRKIPAKTIIIGAIAFVVVIVILALLGTTIYFVRKQRREVVVIYKPPTEGSMISGSDIDQASGYYETIGNMLPPPTASRPTAQMLSDGYFQPADSIGTLRKELPMPADVAFGYDVPYQPKSSSLVDPVGSLEGGDSLPI